MEQASPFGYASVSEGGILFLMMIYRFTVMSGDVTTTPSEPVTSM